MEATAQLRYFRASPRKLKQVIDLLRGQPVAKVLQQLKGMPQASAKPVAKLVASAVANAQHKHKDSSGELYLTRIEVGQGPRLKRFVPRAMGRATPILRPTAHLKVTVSDVPPGRRQVTK